MTSSLMILSVVVTYKSHDPGQRHDNVWGVYPGIGQ